MLEETRREVVQRGDVVAPDGAGFEYLERRNEKRDRFLVAAEPRERPRANGGLQLRVESRRSTSLIEINVYARDAALAAAIANNIARVYSEDRVALATSDQREGLVQ